MLHTVKKVKYLKGYKLQLVFNDGKTKVDTTPQLLHQLALL
jgi:hypothetical protein